MKMPDLSRYMPVGREKSSQPMQGGIFMLVVATLRAVVELMDNYLHARDALYEITPPIGMVTHHRVLVPGAVIRPFPELILAISSTKSCSSSSLLILCCHMVMQVFSLTSQAETMSSGEIIAIVFLSNDVIILIVVSYPIKPIISR